MTDHNLSISQFNPTEQSFIRAMFDKFWGETGSRPLNECGWADFYGISGGDAYDPERWVALGLADKRPHPVYGDSFVYRLTGRGMDFAETLPSPFDDFITHDAPVVDIDDVQF